MNTSYTSDDVLQLYDLDVVDVSETESDSLMRRHYDTDLLARPRVPTRRIV